MPRTTQILKSIRDRFRLAGPEHLADHELLALFLGWGLKGSRHNGNGNGPIELASQTLERTGGLAGLARSELDELVGLPGLGPAKACLLKAAIELGRRAAVPVPPVGTPITRASEVAEWFRCQLQDHRQECLYALMLDSKHRPLRSMRVSEGSWTNCPVDPKVILSLCLRIQAPTVILIHNHPSGDPEPSRDDVILTERMLRAGQVVGIRVLDHIIVGRGGFFSLADAGLL